MLNDELYRLVVRARVKWRRATPACSNEAAMDESRPLFSSYGDNPGIRGYDDCSVRDNRESPLCSFGEDIAVSQDKKYKQ